MHRTFRHLLLGLLAVFLLYIGVFSVAVVSQLAEAADRLHAGAGQWTFWILLATMMLSVLLPTLWLLRLPSALRPPSDSSEAAQPVYLNQLLQHLQSNPHLANHPIRSITEIPSAIAHLQSVAEADIRTQAGSVLASTALLQNGKLDALVVLATQVRMVWRIARIYGLRPSLAQITYLYSNVGACMLLASSFEDVDFAEMAAPIVQASTPAALASVPGLGTLGGLLTNSLASGAANAFLTLRIGLIAQAYCAPLHTPQRSSIRHNATVRAAGLLGQIVREAGSHVTQAVYGRVKAAVSQSAHATADGIRNAGSSVVDAARSATHATGEWVDKAGGKLQLVTLSAADSTARAANAVQRTTSQATQNTRDRLHRAIVTLKGKRDN